MITLSPDIPHRARVWRNLREIWRWCRQYTFLSADDHARWLERIAKDPSIKMFGVFDEDKYGGAVEELGVCGLTSIDKQNQTAEFSLYIRPDMHGRGYGRAALRLLFHHGFI